MKRKIKYQLTVIRNSNKNITTMYLDSKQKADKDARWYRSLKDKKTGGAKYKVSMRKILV